MLTAFQRMKAGNVASVVSELPALIADTTGFAVDRAAAQQGFCVDQSGSGLAGADGAGHQHRSPRARADLFAHPRYHGALPDDFGKQPGTIFRSEVSHLSFRST